MMTREAQIVDRVSRRFGDLKERRRNAADAELLALWASVNGVDDAALAAWLGVSVPVLSRWLDGNAAATGTYVDTSLEVLGYDGPVGPVLTDVPNAIRADGIEARMARPIVEARSRLADGFGYSEAMRRGSERLSSVVKTDMQLAFTKSAHSKMAGTDGRVYYERVPEGAQTCGLCLIAATRRYNRGDLMPIHAGCDCSVRPTTSDATRSTGTLVDRREFVDQLDEVAVELGIDASDRDDLRKVMFTKIEVVEHGDMGPVLTWADQNHEGPPSGWTPTVRSAAA